MATNIDNLQIQISASATKANTEIDKLISRLGKLSTSLSSINGSSLTGLANGVQKLGTAMQSMNSVKTADFTRLANNITRLGNINVSALNSAASSMSHLTRAFNNLGTVSQNAQAVGQMAANLSRLGNKGIQNAIANIPQLATALNGLMTTLARSPRVSSNVIQMTNALANLASQGRNVGTATNTLTSGLNRTNSAMQKSTKCAWSLASAFGRFYASYFLIIRGIKKLWSSIEGTSDYIEAFNYYNVSFGKIASEWSQDWEKFGYENATAYAESFTKRMNQTLGKLSGVQIDVESGLLSETGMKNLGLNIEEVTQYASQLASVTNSVGQTGEVSLVAANVFTKLGADISSLFNQDYSGVMKNLQSGLIGQSRALYKYGIDITNATLQTYAYKLGVEKAVSEMTQAEKMQLRMIAILDQSKVSWGDLANTINSPSNMIRQFKNNLKEAGMVLGQLFIPLLQKVLPVINGVTIAIKRLLVSIAGFFGISLDLSSFGQGYSDMADDASGLSDSLDDATASAKKLKTATLGIDELNINAPQDDTSGASGAVGGGIDLTDEILAATEEYQKVWNEAFENMESKAQAFADKFEKIFEPIKKLFKDISIGDWFAVGGDVSDIAIGIFDYFTDALKKVDWKKIGNNIGDFLAGIKWKDILMSAGNFFETLVDSAIDLWKGSFETAPIETAIITALAIAQFTGLNGIIASKIVSAFPATLSVGKTIAIAGLTFIIGFDIGKEIGKLLFPEDAEYYENFSWFGENGFFSSFTDGSWKGALELWGKDISEGLNAIGDDINKWMEDVKSAFSEKWGEIKEWWSSSTLVTVWEYDILPWFTVEKWSELGENIKTAFSEKWGEIKEWWSNTAISKWWKDDVEPWFTKKKWEDAMKGVKDAFNSTWNSAISSIKGIWNKFATWLNEKLTWTIDPVVIAGKTLFAGATINLGKIPTFQTGGFPEDGLFMANHNELVGQFSNGKTAVANNEQIVAGIKEGVREAVSEILAPYLADIAQNTRETAKKDFSVNIGDRDIARANARGQKSLGYSLVT